MADTTRIQSLNLLDSADGKLYLAELYGKVIENVQKNLLSAAMKNRDLSGDPEAGTVEAKRFMNATSAAYGTARTATKGSAVRGSAVTIAINQDKEIVEELEEKDVRLYGVDGILDRRANNHSLMMATELDKAFFTAAATSASAVTISDGTTVPEALEQLIQACETVSNAYVDGVPRSMMHLVLTPAYYGKIRSALDSMSRGNVDSSTEEFYAFHGVDCKSCVHLPAGISALLIVDGAVAQPVMSKPYNAERIPLSNAWGVSLFYSYGTKVVTPDLLFRIGSITTSSGAQSSGTSGT